MNPEEISTQFSADLKGHRIGKKKKYSSKKGRECPPGGSFLEIDKIGWESHFVLLCR